MRHALQTTAFCLGAALGDAHAEESPRGEDSAQLDRVVITGSHLRRIDAETALPVQVIRRDEIERSGATTAEEIVARLAANLLPFNEAAGLGDRSRNGLSGASLRSYGEGETLVLLNGRRLANFAFSGQGAQGVDLHAIPLAAIDRIEVLKDGASALYGSDAIAGVINFITRSDYQGAETTASYGWSEHGGGARERATLAWGAGDPATRGFNVFGVLDVQRTHGLRATERAFTATAYRPELGIDGTLFTAFPANITLDGGQTFLNPAAPGCTPGTAFHPREGGCWYDFIKDQDLVQPSRQVNLLLRGSLRLSANAEAYAEATLAWDRVRFREITSPVSASATPTGIPFLFPASSPFYPSGLGLTGDLEPLYRTGPLGPRVNDVSSRNRRLLAGLKGQAAGWDVDVALIHNDSRAGDRFVSGFVDADRLRSALATGLVNPFGDSGPEGDALLAAAEARGLAREAQGRTRSIDLRASRDVARLPAGPLAVALGADARHESLSDTTHPLAIDALGPQLYRQSKDGSRRVQALYVETVAPLARGVEAQLAARADRYSDFGSSISPKLALRVQPARSWLLRGSVGRGFRAPSLPELFTAQSAIFRGVGTRPDPLRCPVTALVADCRPQLFLVTGGNPDLKPERSKQASVGIVLEPNAAVQVSLDAWRIELRDAISSISPNRVLFDLARFERYVVRGPVDAAFPNLPGPILRIVTLNQNIGSSRAAGIDLALALRPRPTPLGRFSMRLDGTYLLTLKDDFNGDEDDLLAADDGRAPRWQHTLTFNVDRGAWSATLSQRLRHGYHDFRLDGSTPHVPAYVNWDAQLAWDVSRDTRLTLGVQNLFDRDPPFVGLGYDPGYADPRRRFWTLALTARWR